MDLTYVFGNKTGEGGGSLGLIPVLLPLANISLHPVKLECKLVFITLPKVLVEPAK